MIRSVYLCCLLLFTSGCQDEGVPPVPEIKPNPWRNAEEAPLPALDQAVLEIIRRHGLTGNPADNIIVPAINTPEARLGKALFFAPVLSVDGRTSCASCHHPLTGGSNGLPAPADLLIRHPASATLNRPDTSLATRVRNVATTFNVALWRRHLFADGSIARLDDGEITTPETGFPKPDVRAGSDLVQAAARLPIVSGQPDCTSIAACREKIAERLQNEALKAGNIAPVPSGETSDQSAPAAPTDWLQLFRDTFNAPDGLAKTLVTGQNISKALSAYQRSQLFTKNHWRSYIEGDRQAISEKAKQGALLFYRKRGKGGFDCASCHQGDFFTDENFHHLLMPPVNLAVPTVNSEALNLANAGRCEVTGKVADKFRFRTPSLLNVEVTGPWGHNGAYTTLASVVRHMMDPYQMALNYDRRQIIRNNIQPDLLRANLADMLKHTVDIPGVAFTEKEVQELVAFLLTLTDPCTKNETCLSPWLPDQKR